MTCTICGQETLPGEPVELTPCGKYQNPDAKHVLVEHCIQATARRCMKIFGNNRLLDQHTGAEIKREFGL